MHPEKWLTFKFSCSDWNEFENGECEVSPFAIDQLAHADVNEPGIIQAMIKNNHNDFVWWICSLDVAYSIQPKEKKGRVLIFRIQNISKAIRTATSVQKHVENVQNQLSVFYPHRTLYRSRCCAWQTVFKQKRLFPWKCPIQVSPLALSRIEYITHIPMCRPWPFMCLHGCKMTVPLHCNAARMEKLTNKSEEEDSLIFHKQQKLQNSTRSGLLNRFFFSVQNEPHVAFQHTLRYFLRPIVAEQKRRMYRHNIHINYDK